MSAPDLNLLLTLDAILAEGNVTRAAAYLGLSPSAMSRSLARLRETTGDPLLVRRGRGLVPTPRALELRARVPSLLQEVQAALQPAPPLNLAGLTRTFTVRTRTGFVENEGPALLARVREAAPGVKLHFVLKPDRDSQALSSGSADLETGVLGVPPHPELRYAVLFQDHFIGAVRPGHPLVQAELTPERYALAEHVGVSRRGRTGGPVDDALESQGLRRNIRVMVGDFPAALALTRGADLITTVPERQTRHLRAGLHSFLLPFGVPEVTVALLWHARMDADPAHQWLRGLIVEGCSGPPGASDPQLP